MSDRKRSAAHNDTPRPKKMRLQDSGNCASIKSSTMHTPMWSHRKLPSKPNLLEQFSKEASQSVLSDAMSAGKKGNRWTKSEDKDLCNAVEDVMTNDPNLENTGAWNQVCMVMGTERSAKQCRERWTNYLRPGIKKGEWTAEEEELIYEMYRSFGPRWSAMAKLMKNRTDNDIKNKWNATKRSQRRKEARSPQLSIASTDTESLAALEQCWRIHNSSKKAVTTPLADASPMIPFKQEDDENVTEI
ncbi:hypothetical protein FisN_4Lu510 [Fistulifera solaris]|uniref:Myb proto-oncogene protein n=1 Tax=Fistulifera solaris TaxID=1519565 RepID=A0A1Z5JZK9_FISSO|nr:hypothetical protein FisN_4Lu510 [Fistulifera solaris]|eukprot:GAX19268.1 hypothetical protein FisN_4Lu510 [Fistulifera solaris]